MAELVIADDPRAAAASRVAAAVQRAVDERGSARLAIAGGSAAAVVAVARELIGPAWRATRLTWVDERCVPWRDPASNRGEAHRQGALAVDTPVAVELPLLRDEELTRLDVALARVEAALASDFADGLDVTLLGLGTDGHVASLFPGKPWDVGETRALLVRTAPKPPPLRITLTRAFLATARTHVIYAVGVAKREAIARLLAGDRSLPASGLDGVVVVTDRAGSGEST